MKVQVKLTPTTIVEAEGKNPVEVFQELATLSEVFGESKCGRCGGTDLKYVVRNVQDGKKTYSYFELRCLNKDCRAKLSFGQTDDGIIYPKRYKTEDKEAVLDENGKRVVLGKWGWTIYNRETGKEE